MRAFEKKDSQPPVLIEATLVDGVAVEDVPTVIPPMPQIAIVLDDWGYNLSAFEILKQIDAPLTLAVLPGLRFSRQIAEEAVRSGHEVILHMPMEPKSETGMEPNTLRVGMTAQDIEHRLERALSSIPQVRGVSNHMGSKASENRDLLQNLFKILKEKDLFYLDSVTTGQSLAGIVANSQSLPILRRDVFLDHDPNREAIAKRIRQLIEIAKERGFAIGIGHDEVSTLEVLREFIPVFKQEGVMLVGVSELFLRRGWRDDDNTGD
jgi:uncharacterized protein